MTFCSVADGHPIGGRAEFRAATSHVREFETMLRSVQDLQGVVVEGVDGQIGRARDFYFDDEAWAIRFLVVDTGAWLEGRKVLIPQIAIGRPDRSGRGL